MKLIPLLFQTKMVNAVIRTGNPKTVTRRLSGLKGINEQGAEDEGVLVGAEGYESWDYLKNEWGNFGFDPIDSFRSLWIKINGQESWDSNPWVWVVKFEKTEKPV